MSDPYLFNSKCMMRNEGCGAPGVACNQIALSQDPAASDIPVVRLCLIKLDLLQADHGVASVLANGFIMVRNREAWYCAHLAARNIDIICLEKVGLRINP